MRSWSIRLWCLWLGLTGELTKNQLESFASTVVKCMMDAMRDGSAEARERFPRLLQVIEHYPNTVDLFIAKVRSMLWVSDLLEVRGFSMGPAGYCGTVELWEVGVVGGGYCCTVGCGRWVFWVVGGGYCGL